jgi:hypothetical protein
MSKRYDTGNSLGFSTSVICVSDLNSGTKHRANPIS